MIGKYPGSLMIYNLSIFLLVVWQAGDVLFGALLFSSMCYFHTFGLLLEMFGNHFCSKFLSCVTILATAEITTFLV